MTEGRVFDATLSDQTDTDPTETREWLDAFDAVVEVEGPERAHYLLESLLERSRRGGTFIPHSPYTAYVNTIPPHSEVKSDGDHALEWKIRSLIRWNATAMVVHANREHDGIGGHIASFGSAATLYDVGFNHFFKGQDHPDGPDLIYIQGHSAPGIYARAYLEGRLSEDQLRRFRTEMCEPCTHSSQLHRRMPVRSHLSFVLPNDVGKGYASRTRCRRRREHIRGRRGGRQKA